MRAIDLFAGAGGLGLGFQRAGIDIVLANDIEKKFVETYRENHPRADVIDEPIQSLSDSTFRKYNADIVAGGPPCQGFSTLGLKKQNDPRNNLGMEFLRVVKSVRPKFVLFENVSGFKNLYNGIAYQSLMRGLSGLGYEINSAVLDAADYGLPQFRKRTIIFGWEKDNCPVSFPRPTHGDDMLLRPRRKLWDAISDLPELESGQSRNEYAIKPLNDYQRRLRGSTTTLSFHNCANYGKKMQKILSLIPAGGSIEDIPQNLRPAGYFMNTYARLLPGRPAPTMTRNFGTPSSSRCVHPFQNRALSTREGARLQSFPDGYFFHGGKGMQNLQIGNAVPPILAEVLAGAILDAAMMESPRKAVG